MNCFDINECFTQISAYCDEKHPGFFLLVNTENYDIYQKILQRLQADDTKTCCYVSENLLPIGLPDIDLAISKVTDDGEHALIGLSQALMLHSEQMLKVKIGEILKQSIKGHGIILLDHCEGVLKKFDKSDKRVKDRVIYINSGATSSLPQIRIVKANETCLGGKPLQNIGALLKYLENLTDAKRNRNPDITVMCDLSVKFFSNSVYSVKETIPVYEVLCQKYIDIAAGIQKNWGSEAQWRWLANQMNQHMSFSSLISEVFGSTHNLSSQLSKVMSMQDANMQWLLWLAMKVFDENNQYLKFVLERCSSIDTFIEQLYMALADVKVTYIKFEQYYDERKLLLEKLPEKDLSLLKKYCDKLGIYQKNEIYYLTDGSDTEKYEFARCMSTYTYSKDELYRAIENMPKIKLYMKEFVFDPLNTLLPAEDNDEVRKDLTSYFNTYKEQKLINRIYPEFLETVEKYALARPYNKLQARSKLISRIGKNDTQLFFFDALGVEYLAFIMAKCDQYGMLAQVSIGRCELPSITSENQEFFKIFKEDSCFKIDKLDEIKHHSQKYDYQKCKYPIHLFAELDVIDNELRNISTMLDMGNVKKAVIVSDHGASRLAVLYGQESDAFIKLDESGEHSGRCCPAEKNPDIPGVAYENNYAMWANYERFKGGRRANVEVHGGASLEEVVVPVIVLTNKPTDIDICFIDSVINIKGNKPAVINVFTNVPVEAPSLKVSNGIIYKGEFLEDNKHIKFVMPELRRTQKLTADFYDGNKKLASDMEFRVQRATQENPLFKDDKLH